MPTPQTTSLDSLRQKIRHFLDRGYSKSELARSLEISRSTLISFLNDPKYSPSSTLINRIKVNLEWLEKSHGHELLEGIILFYCSHHELFKYFKSAVNVTEKATGFQVGYHGMVLGGPVGFIYFYSPGIEPLTDFINQDLLPQPSMGHTETLISPHRAHFKGNHQEARLFYQKHPQARMYLKFFKNYNYRALSDLQNLEQKVLPKFKDSIYCLEAGLLTGEYDYFLLVVAKDQQAYIDFLIKPEGVYSVTEKSFTRAYTRPIIPQGVRPLFDDNHFNLSFAPEQLTK